MRERARGIAPASRADRGTGPTQLSLAAREAGERRPWSREGGPHPAARARRESTPSSSPTRAERQFARLLDFYQIEWEYEPRSFDLECDSDGNVIQRFTPDFYLPAYDLYIEITTLNQKLVTRKNRKVRRLRELYPEVQCKVFYQRDYLSLVTKYGLDDDHAGCPSPAARRRMRRRASGRRRGRR